MKLGIPRGLRYRTVNLLEGSPSAFSASVLRGLISSALLLMAAPRSVANEIHEKTRAQRPDFKSAMRAMLWIWNRSWLPFKFQFGTYFDIGWYLSEDSCRSLTKNGFVKPDPLERCCDLAQLELASIREGVRARDAAKVEHADQAVVSLVKDVLNDAFQWARRCGSAAEVRALPLAQLDQPTRAAENRFDNDRTRSALLDFDDLVRPLNLSYFLVSGTFLGAVREGAFIGHDHDIDLGLFEHDLSDELIPLLSESRDFVVVNLDYICLRRVDMNGVHYAFMAQPAIIRLAHKTGISIDLFVHFRDGERVWHGSSVHRWDNEKFDLAEYQFLGRSFRGARDFDLYLTENYGPDWRVPKSDFNVNFDTPNLSFAGTANALVYFAWMVAHAVWEKDVVRVRRYIDMLLSLSVLELKGDELSLK